jgi:hypothetical protein
VPEVSAIDDAAVVFISTEIGRGHPGYLDGLVETIRTGHPQIRYFKSDVFSLSQGLSLAAWKAVRRMYRIGGRGGAITSAYGHLRQATGTKQGRGRLLHILGSDLHRHLSRFSGAVVVAHPLVARILASYYDVIYQHGELAAPPESFVPGCRKILVPLEETATRFVRAGFSDNDILITGQCIEIDLVPTAPDAFHARLSRLHSDQPLTIALFSSGAYPRDHLAILRRAAISLIDAGHTVYLFAGHSPHIMSDFTRRFEKARKSKAADQSAFDRLHIIHTRDRAEENRQFAAIFSRVDLFFAPAHERTNWAVGLGLPQIMLTPHIGSYAPLNARIAMDRQVAAEIADSHSGPSAADHVRDLRQSGRLAAMAENGFGRTAINGFARAADFIAD